MAVSILIPAFNPDLNLPAYVRELCEAGFSHIVVIDDGSFQEKQEIFQRLETEYGCLVLRHAVNMGKGRALKDALNYYQVFLSRECSGVITADCDGQHTVEDIRRMGQAMEEHPDSLILGARDFDQKNVPAKSRVGNKLTRTVMRLFYGGKISDTQTGLRAIPNSLVEEYLTLPGARFEFETAMLLTALRRKTRIEEVPIQTVYLDGNKSTHFRPVADSWAIYKLILGTFFKYSLSSLSSCLIDFALFQLLLLALGSLSWEVKVTLATVAARVCSSLYNYAVNRQLVFSRGRLGKGPFLKYYILCAAQMLCSAGGVLLFCQWARLPELPAKIVVDGVLFFISYRIQRNWVFAERGEREKS